VVLSQERSVAIENTDESSTASYHYLDATRTERRAQARTLAKDVILLDLVVLS